MADYNTPNYNPNINPYVPGIPIHDEYINHHKRWKYLINSYMGSSQYRMGEYLTRYIYESNGDYTQRLGSTPLDNHVKSIVHIYNSFLYRNEPKRDYGSLQGTPEIKNFLEDCDMEGRTWSSFMRDVNLMSTVYGHVAVLVDRPESQAGTRADELQSDIRPYVTIFTPENILDWHWRRLPSGHYELDYVKFLEEEEKTYSGVSTFYVRTWTKDTIKLEKFSQNKEDEVALLQEKINPLGKVPVTWVYANRSPIRGIGVSDIGDIADFQNAIYNEISEIEQLIRLSNHPSLVKTRDTEASAGAGAIITMPENLDPGLAPRLLQPNGQNLDAILSSIDGKVKAIDRMAHLGSIRAIETRQMSGLAMQTEYATLDAKLCEKARNLELAEEQIWRNWFAWQGEVFDGDIKYPMAFQIRDKNLDMDILKKAAEIQRDSATATPEIKSIIDDKIKEILAKDDDELEQMRSMQHPTTTPANRSAHIQEMIMEGLTDQQMLDLHPEINQADIDTAKRQLLNIENESSNSQAPTDISEG